MQFQSDNTSGVCPAILDAVNRAAGDYAAPYGDDEESRRLDEEFSEFFETGVSVWPVITGTAANSLALSVLSPPYGAIFCHRESHIFEHEAGAPELFTGGARLVALHGDLAKFDAGALETEVARFMPGFEHMVQPAAVSLTQATERGAVYTAGEIAAITSIAKAHSLKCHMDGARFANALVYLDASPADITWRAGIDVLSFGTTKNGTMGAEALVFFDPGLAGDLKYRRKRAGHLLSKMRYVSVQLRAYLDDAVWKDNARIANRRAAELYDGLRQIGGIECVAPPQSNMLFVWMPQAVVDALYRAGATFYAGEGPEARDDALFCRLVTSFSTTGEDVGSFLEAAGEAA